MNILRSVGCLFLVIALLFSMTSPAFSKTPVLSVQVNAEELDNPDPSEEPSEDPSEDPNEDPSEVSSEDPSEAPSEDNPVKVQISFTGENCEIFDADGNDISAGMEIDNGTVVSFKVIPSEGYKVVSVTAGEQVLTAEDGAYNLTADQSIVVSVVVEQKTAPNFTVLVLPSGPVKAKSFQVTIEDADAEISITAYAKMEYATLEALQTALDAGDAFLIQDSTTVSENGTYYVYVVDVDGRMSIRMAMVEEIDTIAPVFQAVTREEESWQKQASYTITFEDPADIAKVELIAGEDTSELTSSEGVYSFTIRESGFYTLKVTDTAGNEASYSFTENEVDSLAPVIDSITRDSDIWAVSAVYTIQITETGSGISEVTVTCGGEALSVTEENSIYSFTATTNDVYEITVTDITGNTVFTTVTEEKIDKENPQITSADAQTTWDTTQNTICFTASDDGYLQRVSVTDSNGTPCAVAQTDTQGTSYTATVTSNGVYTIAVEDGIGNTATAYVTVDHIDTEAPGAPEIRSSGNQNWGNTDVTLTATASDSQSGIAAYWYSSSSSVFDEATWQKMDLNSSTGTVTMTAEQDTTIYVIAQDQAGRVSQVRSVRVAIDKTGVDISQPERKEEGWAASSTYTFTITETASGLDALYLIVGSSRTELTPNNNGLYQIEMAQNQTFTILALDNAGNETKVTITEDHIDTSAPELLDLTRIQDGWAQKAEYQFRAQDTGSGVAAVTLTVGDAAVVLTANDLGLYGFELAENVSFTILIEDALGFSSSYDFAEQQVDTTDPVIASVVRDSRDWSYNGGYTICVSDNLSGIAFVTVQCDDGTACPVTGSEGTYFFTAKQNGTYTITTSDEAGNTATETVIEHLLDQTQPVISNIQRLGDSWQQKVTYSFQAEDSDSGIASVTVTQGDLQIPLTADNGYSFMVEANASYTITIKDTVGNTATETVTENQIDTSVPEIKELKREQDSWTQKATFAFQAADAASGIASVTLTVNNGEPVVLTPDASGLYRFSLTENAEVTIVATDSVGNTATYSHAEKMVDTSAPVINEVKRITSGWSYNADYQITAGDDLAGIQSVTVALEDGSVREVTDAQDGTFLFVTAKNDTYTVTVTDLAGNSSATSVTEQLLDQTGPEITKAKRSTDTWSQSTVYTFQVEDPSSGVASVKIRLGDTEIPLTEEDGTYSFQAYENGDYIIEVRDTVGNLSTSTVPECLIDLTAPKISAVTTQTEWDLSENTAVITASDDKELVSVTVNDEAGIYYTVTNLRDGSFQTVLNHNGAYTATATDRAGNITRKTFTIQYIDTLVPSAPELTSSGKELWVNSDVTLTASSADTQSGVIAYWYATEIGAFNAETWTKMELNEGIGSVTLAAEQDAVYYIVAQDLVGRISEISAIRVAIDKTAPETIQLNYLFDETTDFVVTEEQIHIYNDAVSFFMQAEDTASGVVRYEYSVGNTDNWTEVDGDKTGCSIHLPLSADTKDSIYIRAWDEAGNCTESMTQLHDGEPQLFIVEITPAEEENKPAAPDVNMTAGESSYSGAWTKENVLIEVSGSEAISGIAYYEWRMVPADSEIPATEWVKVPTEEGAAQFTVDKDTNATYYFRAVTYAGNISQEISQLVRVQKTLPNPAVITPDVATGTNGWYTVRPKYQVQLPEQYAFGAPVQYKIRYTFNEESLSDILYNGSNAPVLNQDGIWTLQIIAVDDAGNESPSAVTTICIDTVAPSDMTVTMNGLDILTGQLNTVSYDKVVIEDHVVFTDYTLFPNKPVNILATAQGGDSGLATIYYQVVAADGTYTPDGEWKQLTEGGFDLSPDMKARLYFMAVDGAGNTTYFSGKSILLDNQPGNMAIIFTNNNLSGHGIYFGDVTVDVSFEDPVVNTAFSGLQSVTYRVLNSGNVTQTGTLYPGVGETVEQEGRIIRWNGQVMIDSSLNNSNNIALEVTAVDLAGNATVLTSDTIQIDITKPAVTGSYTGNTPAAQVGDVSYFTGSRIITVVVEELNFVGGESVITVTDLDTDSVLLYDWNSTGTTHVASIPVVLDGNYTVTAQIVDGAGNRTDVILFDDASVATGAFVLDNMAPVVSVSYDNNDAKNDSYFDASRTATITVTERNFDPERFVDNIRFQSPEGEAMTLTVGGWISDGSEHTAYITFEEDGTYSLSVTASDIPGNLAEATNYYGTATRTWVIDQEIAQPAISGVEDNASYAKEVIPSILFQDYNLDNVQLQLFRTTYGNVDVDITETLAPVYTETVNGKHTSLDIFPMDDDSDGIYTLVATMTDKAGNTASSKVTFSVNRNGSTYAYDEGVISIMGTSMQQLDQDLVITEINPSRVVPQSVTVQITRNGTPIANPSYAVTPMADGSEIPGDNGWYEYRYIISKDNFTEDGIYVVTVSTKDAAGNLPENTGEGEEIRFAIDTAAPVLTSVIGLEEPIVKADSLNVMFTAIDNIGLNSMTIYVDDQIVAEWTELEGYSLEESFQITEGLERHVRVVLVDDAGNTMDTEKESFDPGYGWQDVTVSSNFWLRYYANKPLFYGSIAVAVVLIGSWICFLVIKNRKKRSETLDS